MEDWDVIVVGAGPAGSAAAITVRRFDPTARVLLLDRSAFPRDKTCGDAIASHAFEELALIGVHGIEDGWPEIWHLHLRAPGGKTVTGRCTSPNRIIPRMIFDASLVEAATARGVVLRTQRARTLDHSDGQYIVNGAHRAGVVIAADGANSTIRRLVDQWAVTTRRPRHRSASQARRSNSGRHRAIAVRAYASTSADEDTTHPAQHIEFLKTGWPAYAWTFPLPDGRANVGYGLRTSALAGGGKPELLRRLRQALPDVTIDDTTVQGHPLPFSTKRPAPNCGGVLFVGDAAGLINPLTGEGIFYAIASGRMAARAASRQHPGQLYAAMLRRRFGHHFATTGVLARLLDIQALMPIMIDASREPDAFANLAEIGLGEGRVTSRLAKSVVGTLVGVTRHALRAGRRGTPPLSRCRTSDTRPRPGC